MCDSTQLKKPFYQVAQQDSRNLANVGHAVGWKGLENAANYNVKNPGHAVSTAAEVAGLIMAPYLLGGEGAFAGGTAEGAALGEGGVTAGGEVAAEELAAQQAAQAAAQVPQGLANTMEAGMTDTGYTPSSLWNALQNPSATSISAANSGLGTSLSQTGLLSGGSAGGMSSGKLMAAQQGLKMMMPEQPQQRPQSMPMQGQQAPLPNLYENRSPYGTSAGNSMGFTEEQKKKLRELGYKI